MIQSFLESFIKTNGKKAFITRLNSLLNFMDEIQKSVILSLIFSIILFTGALVYLLYNIIDLKLRANNTNLVDLVTLITMSLIIFSLMSIIIYVKKLIKINVVKTLIEDLIRDIGPIDDLDKIIILASKWVRKLSRELSISRAMFSRILVKANYNNFRNLKQLML